MESVSIQMGIMFYEDQYFYTLKKDNCNHSTIIKMKSMIYWKKTEPCIIIESYMTAIDNMITFCHDQLLKSKMTTHIFDTIAIHLKVSVYLNEGLLLFHKKFGS